VVIDDLDLSALTVPPHKTEPPLVIDADAVLAFAAFDPGEAFELPMGNPLLQGAEQSL
jgi:hypothetical protein